MGESLVFEHETLGQRVLFGTGHARAFLAQKIRTRGASRVMVIASERERKRNAPVLEGLDIALVYDDVAQPVPLENAERARSASAENGIDLLVCIGGGSATGLE